MRKSILELAQRCVRCGFCLDACPTYRLSGNEAASPRGRIRMMSSVVEGRVRLSSDLVEQIDLCLGCRACETACPSAVRYGAMLEDFRGRIEQSNVRPALRQGAKSQLIATMASPQAFAASLRASGFAAPFLSRGDGLPAPMAYALGVQPGHDVLMPATPARPTMGTLPEFSPAEGERRYTVCILQGCVMRVLYHRTNAATVRVLQRAGCDVMAPQGLGCCGALDIHAGYAEEARTKARAALDCLRGLRFDAFVVNSAGCGSTLKEYGELLGDDPVYAAEAQALAQKVRDVSEFLADIGTQMDGGHFPEVVTYHDACHLVHGQSITDAPRGLLRAIPGLSLVPLAESDMCCGSAGTYNIIQPEMARRLLDRKVANIAASGATVVAMGNPGCMAWIQKGLELHSPGLRVMHVIEILDAAAGRSPTA